MKNSQNGLTVRLLVLIIILLVVGGGVYVYRNQKVDVETNSNLDSNIPKITSISETTIQVGSRTISINDFPDEVQVSKDASFGSSEKINNAWLSPAGKWIAIAVGGSAHDFGWLYNMTTQELKPIAFSYGGGISIKEWKNNSEVVLIITSPKPETMEQVINVDQLPEYPKLVSNNL